MTISAISFAEALKLIEVGATLVDIRDADEHVREYIPGAINVPLSRLCELPSGPVVFHCRSGAQTTDIAPSLTVAAKGAPGHLLAGGIDGWRAAGLPTRFDTSLPLEIMRQGQLAAGSLVLIGVALGFLVAPAFFGVSALVGADG